jgi:hypothetical protein
MVLINSSGSSFHTVTLPPFLLYLAVASVYRLDLHLTPFPLVPLEFFLELTIAHGEKLWVTTYGSRLVEDFVGRGWRAEEATSMTSAPLLMDLCRWVQTTEGYLRLVHLIFS